MTKLHQLADIGQAIWLDYIRRAFLVSGEMQRLVDMGLRGMTSNPTIFEKAINGTQDYAEDLRSLVAQGRSASEIYESLAIHDIQAAADLLRPVYDDTRGSDGFVSLEVDPTLANDGAATAAEASRLWQQVDRPNLMIKIPGTLAGLPAITQSIASGINVNVTLIFSLARYQQVMEAYLAGLELRSGAGQPIDRIASVASFFVSRVDSKVDKELQQYIQQNTPNSEMAAGLMGKAAVANAKLAYSLFKEVFSSPRFERLKAAGAKVQRPLWASTSTKNPAFSDILYVQELIGRDTVNTLPQNTLDAFIDHGEVCLTIEDGLDKARMVFESLENLGVSMDQVTRELEEEGVASFAASFKTLMESIEQKRKTLAADNRIEMHLGKYQAQFDSVLKDIAKNDILPRIWSYDHTVWRSDPAEISNRLGWLHIAEEMRMKLPQIEALTYAVTQAGYTHALLLGMGGSSLAPELFSVTFSAPGHLHVQILDSTHPGAVLEFDRKIDPAHCLYIVSTKSGGTEETLSLFKYFYNRTIQTVGAQQAGDHFIAITDPGSKLVEIAQKYAFRAVFLNDPNIGGRYSALSFFGLVPAALAGVDLGELLKRALAMAQACGSGVPVETNPAAQLGAVLGALSSAGRDKVTFVLSPEIITFGDWVEQLIAESTGKQGKGILPVAGEPLGAPELYGQDRLFVQISLGNASIAAAQLARLEAAGHPLVVIHLKDVYDLGGQILLWELATAIAGHIMHIQPFDQPNVEAAKKMARKMLAAYRQEGSLPREEPALVTEAASVYGKLSGSNLQDRLITFVDAAKPGDYIAIQAFLHPRAEIAAALHAFRKSMREHTHLATTLGFGPRFLHSTGQLHKGDGGNGLFIQFTADIQEDAPIPDEAGSAASSTSFGVLVLAQALGDAGALLEASRRVLRIHIHASIVETIHQLSAVL